MIVALPGLFSFLFEREWLHLVDFMQYFTKEKNLSQLMTEPIKFDVRPVKTCSVLASTQSDQSLHCAFNG